MRLISSSASERARFVQFLAVGCCLFSVAGHTAEAADWPQWRGPNQNNTSPDKGLIESWDPKGGPGSNLLWKNEEIGGRSTPIVMNGRLYTIARHNPDTVAEQSKVVCVDAATGEKLWQHVFSISLTDVPNTRVAWSSCVGDPGTGYVYAHAVSGYFCCLEGETGAVVWERRLHEEFGMLSTYGGRTNFPLVFDDLVIASGVIIGWGDSAEWGSLAKPAHRFLGMDKKTGEVRWLNGTGISPYDTTYSTPTLAMLDGQATMVFGSGDGALWAMQPRTGKRLWSFPFSDRGLNVSPLVIGDTVYSSHSEENKIGNAMGGLVALKTAGQEAGKDIWRKFEVMAGKSSPIPVGDKLWVVDDRAKLFIFDPQTGERLTRKALGTVMRSTPLYADGKVYLCTNNGRWYILEPSDRGVKVLHKLRLKGESSDGSPIAADGRIYLPTSAAVYCLATEQPDPAPAAEWTFYEPPSDPTKQAQLQLSPYDSLLAPGDSLRVSARLFDEEGRLLSEAAAGDLKLTVTGVGEIDEAGVYTAPADASHEAVLISAEYKGLSASARVRVVPPLPWSFDFNQSSLVPLTWVGGRVRYVIREVDGERVAVKRNLLPTPRDPNNKLGTRSRMWMGPIDLSDYTIEADVMLLEDNARLADVGLINSGYTFTLRGRAGTGVSGAGDAPPADPAGKPLRLYSWASHDYRASASADFEPAKDTWYTMKLRVEQRGDSAAVSGKIWPRNETEPNDWSVSMYDASPITSGSPGLYGNAQEAEFCVDNVKVYAN